jgi:Uma2 family endonuclease
MTATLLDDSTGRKMSDEEFERFCQDNPELRIERNSNLEISIMSPNTPLFSEYEQEVSRQLSNWNFENKKGKVFSPSAGFTLADNSILSPDASWISNEKWSQLPEHEKDKFSHICPEFVIEVKSKTDSLKALKLKMESWIKNGATLAWLIDPKKKICWIYKPGAVPKELSADTRILRGEGVIEGFELNLELLN